MKCGKKNVVALLTIALLGCLHGAMAQESRIKVHPIAWTQLELKGTDKDLASMIAAQITANPENAEALVKALVAANPEHAAAIVSSAIVTLDVGVSTSRIVAAAVAAAPSKAAAITSTAMKVAPSQAVSIVRAAVQAAPTQSVPITVAALAAAPNNNQTQAIINSAIRVAPRDGQTVADLQSLATRNFTPQNNTQQNFIQSQQLFNSSNQPGVNPPPLVPPVENLRGGASPS